MNTCQETYSLFSAAYFALTCPWKDEPQVMKKLALYVYKFLSNQATVWPFSVPVTDDRIAKCQDLLDEYFL